MRHVKLLILLVITSIGSAWSQEYGKFSIDNLIGSVTKSNTVQFVVVDSLTKIPLPGANIRVVSNKDTISLVYSGDFDFISNANLKDSVEIIISYMGYNTFHRYMKLTPPTRLNIFLSQKRVEMAELVVKGRTMSYVIDKDTIKFLPSAVRLRDGSTLEELLLRFPGIEVTKSGIRYNGRDVEKLYVDKEKLFANNISAAISNLMADDIVDIKVYEEKDEFDEINKVKHPKKVLVANIDTKSKLKSIKSANVSILPLSLSSAVSTPRFFKTKDNITIAKQGDCIDVHADASKNTFEPIKSEDYGVQADFRKVQDLKYNYNGKLTVKTIKQNNLNWIRREYNNTDELNAYIQEDNDRRHTSGTSLGTIQNIEKWDKDKSLQNFGLGADISNSRGSYTNQTEYSSNYDSNYNWLNTNDIKSKKIYAYIFHHYKKSFKDTDLKLDHNIGFNITNRDENDRKIDSLFVKGGASSLYGTSKFFTYAFDDKFYITKDFHYLSIGFLNSFRTQYSNNDIWYENLSNNLVDSLQTRNNKFGSIQDNVGAFIGVNGDKWSLAFTVKNSYYFDRVTDLFPNRESNKREMDNILYNLSFERNIGIVSSLNILFIIGPAHSFEYEPINFGKPTSSFNNVDRLRSKIVEESKTELYAGVSNLKQSFEKNLSVNYSITTKSIGMFQVGCVGRIASDCIGRKIEHFYEETFLEKYNYTASKGATLTTFMNIGKAYSFEGQVSYSTFINPIKSKFNISYNYRWRQVPYIQNDTEINKYRCDNDFSFVFTSGFSKSIEVKFYAGLRDNNNHSKESESRIKMGYVSANVDINLTQNLRVYVFPDFHWTHSSVSSLANRNEFDIPMGMIYTLRKFPLEFRCSLIDVFKTKKPLSIRYFDNYVETSQKGIVNGRSFFVQMTWRPKW